MREKSKIARVSLKKRLLTVFIGLVDGKLWTVFSKNLLAVNRNGLNYQ